MKRLISLGLLIVLCFVFAGCESKQEASAVPTANVTKNQQTAAQEAQEPFSLRNGVTWKMTKEQLTEAEKDSNMVNKEAALNENWNALMYYPAPVVGNYVFRLMYMMHEDMMRAIIYDSGSDLAETEYADLKTSLVEAYGQEKVPEAAEVVKVLDVMLPGMYTEANIGDPYAWQYGTDTLIYMFKYKGDMFIIMYVDATLIAE